MDIQMPPVPLRDNSIISALFVYQLCLSTGCTNRVPLTGMNGCTAEQRLITSSWPLKRGKKARVNEQLAFKRRL